MFRSMFGGIHLESRKQTTQRKPLALLEVAPDQVILPLSTHLGALTPIVKVGDEVAWGQPVTDGAQGMVSHASISGTVVAIEPRPHPEGGRVQSIVIENDAKNTVWTQDDDSHTNYERLSAEQVIQRITGAGITDMGGAGVPAGAKLTDAWGKVDTLIINAAESEPYITADHRLLLERGESVLIGAQILKKAVGALRAVIAVESSKINAVEKLERKLENLKLNIEICTVPSRYPVEAEKQVVKSVTGREVPPDGGATDVGCVIFNAATAFAVQQALVKNRPLTHRVVTITGGALKRPRNLWVPIGTPMRELVSAAGGFSEPPKLMLTGGSMMGTALTDLDAPVIKQTNALVCLGSWEVERQTKERVCIRCGRCVSVCPMHLMPLLVNRELSLGGDTEELRRLHTGDCMACGCCTYVCPAHIPLTERMGEATRRVVQADAQKEERQ